MQMLEEVNAVRKQYGTVCDDEDMRWESECQYTAKEIELETFYSLENDDVMPTAIGNVFRAFEQYPGRRYGIDAVLFWPRLTSVISPEVARVVEETNNTLTFLLTSCLMCSLLGVESLAVMLIKMVPRSAVRCVIDGSFLRIPIARPSEYCFYGLFAICVFILAFGLKHGALKASIAFGELVKSCFDLFHQDLLKKMAGETALQDEWRAWTRLQRSILVDRNAWLPEWEEDEEQEKVQNADKPASRSCLDHVFISGLTAAFLVKEIFCGDISAPACSDSRTDHTALAERSL
ncbi:MAG: hypothetical protein SWK90_05270 [Chloroflexota bacterium]|nr:hypothetical protein [Chloroflexota bacterium]